MPADTQLSRALSRPDPFMNFKWVAKSVPFGEAVTSFDNSYIQNVELPFSNVQAESIFFCGAFKYFPGFSDTSAFNISFYGDSAGRSLSYLMYWKKQVKNFETGIYNLPGQYKRDWTFALLNTSGDIVLEVEMIGCWPADTGQLSLAYDSSEALTFNQNFATDGCRVLGTISA